MEEVRRQVGWQVYNNRVRGTIGSPDCMALAAARPGESRRDLRCGIHDDKAVRTDILRETSSSMKVYMNKETHKGDS